MTHAGPPPEPEPVDEENSLALAHLVEDAILRGKPNGDERCEKCRHYLDHTKDISYCWHPKVRILVGAVVVPVVGGDPGHSYRVTRSARAAPPTRQGLA